MSTENEAILHHLNSALGHLKLAAVDSRNVGHINLKSHIECVINDLKTVQEHAQRISDGVKVRGIT